MQKLQFETEPLCIPYADFARSMTQLEYASTCRVMLQMLAYTGCRLSELDKMDPSMIMDDMIYWRPGKNQKGLRKEHLPHDYVIELAEYRRTHRVSSGRLFGVSHGTFRRYFNRDARPLIGGRWTAQQTSYLSYKGYTKTYVLQLKGFRKNFQTILFKYFYDKYGDASVALEWVSKRMKHSSEHITAYHYLQNYSIVQTDKWIDFLNTGCQAIQRRLLDFTITI